MGDPLIQHRLLAWGLSLILAPTRTLAALASGAIIGIVSTITLANDVTSEPKNWWIAWKIVLLPFPISTRKELTYD